MHRDRAGLWFVAPDHRSTGNLAVVSNPVFIGHGLWTWPNRFGKDDWFWIDIPVGYLYTIGNPRTDWCFRTEPDPGLNGRSILYARGKVLGGCSSINAMLYLRGQAADSYSTQ